MATTPNVGVRVFSDLSSTLATIEARETYAGVALPVPGAENTMPIDEPFVVDLSKPEEVEAFPVGTMARDTLNIIRASGIVTDVIFQRTDEDGTLEGQISKISGDAGAQTGVYGLASAKSHVGIEPSFIIAPGYTSQRLGNAANPVAAAINSVCDEIIDCMGVVDTPVENREKAAEYAADFATSYNMIAAYPNAIVNTGSGNVVRPLSPHIVAAHLRRDAQAGNPYKAAWNRPLNAVLGPSQLVSYRDGSSNHDANFLNQNGVVTVIERNLYWGPFSTATDPTTRGYRSIKRIRTRRSIEKSFLRSLRQFNAQDLGPHLVTLLYESLANACAERVSISALIDYEIVWDRDLNSNTSLRDGGLNVKLRFEETPDLVDLNIFTEPQPEAFDILAGRIGQALAALGNPNIRVAG